MSSRTLSRATSLPALAALVALTALVLSEAMYHVSVARGAALVAGPGLLALVAWRPMLGLYGGLLTIPFEASRATVSNTHLTPSKVLLIVTAASVLPRLLREAKPLHPGYKWFAGLLALSILGLTFAPNSHAVLAITVNATAYMLISIYVSRMTRSEVEQLLVVLVVAGGVVGVAASLMPSAQVGAAASSAAATRAQLGFDSPNVLGFFLLMTLGPALAMLAEPSVRRQRLLSIAATPVIILGLISTLSRTSIIGAGLTALVLLAGSARFRKLAVTLATVVLIIVAFDFGPLTRSPVIRSIGPRLATLSSVSGVQHDPRVMIWKTVPRIISDHPLVGVGEGNFPYISASYGLRAFDLTPIDHAHDIFLTVAAELGLIGLAVFLGFLFTIVRSAWRALTRTKWRRAPVVGVVASLVGLSFPCLGDYPPRAPTILATMLMIVGTVFAFERHAEEATFPAQGLITRGRT